MTVHLGRQPIGPQESVPDLWTNPSCAQIPCTRVSARLWITSGRVRHGIGSIPFELRFGSWTAFDVRSRTVRPHVTLGPRPEEGSAAQASTRKSALGWESETADRAETVQVSADPPSPPSRRTGSRSFVRSRWQDRRVRTRGTSCTSEHPLSASAAPATRTPRPRERPSSASPWREFRQRSNRREHP